MHLLLLRHAPAVDQAEWSADDRERPLTNSGIARLRLVCKALRSTITVTELWTSPWLRARQTAEIAAEIWQLPLREQAWLAGGAMGPAERAMVLDPLLDVGLIGHEPDLSMFAGYLLGAQPLTFRKAGVAVLQGEPNEGGMTLQLWLAPKQLLQIAARD